VFRLGSLGPFFAAELVTQKTWQVAELEKVFNLNGYSYNPNYGMTDSLLGRHVHHFPVFLGLDTLLGLWFFLAVVRNIKRDPQEYEIYSPSQSLVFALFLNLIFLAFFNWQLDTDSDAVSFLLSLNMAVFILLGLALLRNRERTRRILRSKADSLWLVNAWPAPILYLGTLTAGAMVAAGALLSHAPKQLDLRFQLLRVLFFAFWLVRDLQFLQWASLRKGRSRLFESLPRAGFGLRQRLLAFLFLARLDFLCGRRDLLRFGLRDGCVLQLDLIVQIVEGGLGCGNTGLGLGNLGLVVGGIDLDQEIAGLDALKILHRHRENFAGHPAGQPRQLGTHIGVGGGLDGGTSDPGIPALRCQRDKAERDNHREQRDGEAA